MRWLSHSALLHHLAKQHCGDVSMVPRGACLFRHMIFEGER
jgi:hypothetical protein